MFGKIEATEDLINQLNVNAGLDAEMVDIVKKNYRSENLKSNDKAWEEQEQPNFSPKIDPEYTEHMKTYKQIISFYAMLGKLFGSIISYDWIPSRHFFYYVTCFLVNLSEFSIVYTILYHYNNGDYQRIVEPLAFLGMTASCAMKWYSYIKNWPKLFSLLFFPRKLCLENIHGRRADIIATGLRKTCTVLKAFTVGEIPLLCLFPIVPLYFYFVKNILVPLIPLEIIFCDQSTLPGYLCATTIFLLFGGYAGLATVMYGSAFLICVSNYTFLVDLIAQDFADLDEMWNGSNGTTVTYRYTFLSNICEKIQDMGRYLDEVKGIYQRKLFFYFLINYFAQVICLYEIQKNDWIAGYPIAFILFVEMMFYCLIGTQILIADDRLCNIIYETNWYTYDMMSQNIIKSIYSLYTVMMEAT